MKRTLIFDKGALGQQYGQTSQDGSPLRARRLEQAGRLELVQVTNDPPPVWLVLIRNFNQERDPQAGAGTPWSNGVWRFLKFEEARTKFEQLSALPIFVEERARTLAARAKSAQRIKALQRPFPKKQDLRTTRFLAQKRGDGHFLSALARPAAQPPAGKSSSD